MPAFYQRFQESARKFPNNVALEIQRHDTVERATFAELTRMSESVANWLSTRVARDARVAILAANHPRWVAAYLGIIAAGRTAVPLDTAFHAEQVKKLLTDSGASLLFCDAKHLPAALEAVKGLKIALVMTSAAAELVATNAASTTPTHGTERDERGTQGVTEHGSTLQITARFAADLDSIFAAGPAGFQPVVPAESDLAALLYTSGTTADPKGVMLTHANLVGEANSVLGLIKIGPADALLGILPMFHVLAQMANLFLPLFNGARVVYLETLNTTELLRALQERDITAFCVVPQFFYLIHERIFKELNKRGKFTLSLVRTLMALNRALRRVGVNAGKLFFGKIHATFGARMRYLVTGGSRFDPAIARDFYSFGIDILNAYGLTETTGGAFINPPGHIVFGSVGRPFPGVEARIVEEKTAQPKSDDDGAPPSGEIAIRGAIVMKGYWNRPQATAEVLRDGWLYTGDLGYFDSADNLFITGRRKEIIVLANGKNVYPEEIEAHYLQTQNIKEICVMALEARPGDPTSERLHAVVVPNFDLLRERKIVNSKEVIRLDIEALSHKIASTKRLGSYDIWQEELPRTTTRKLKRFQIEKKVRELKQNDGSVDSDVGKEREKPLTVDEQLWLQREDVKRALAILRESSRNQFDAILPSHNLELDLGLDSMQRIELLTALEQQFGGEVPESQLAGLYSVHDLVDAVLASASRGEGRARAAAPAWSTILGESSLNELSADPEVVALAHHNPFTEVFFFLLGRLIYLFALDRFHFKIRGLENLPEKGPYLICSNHQSYVDPLVMTGALPWRLFRDVFAVGTSDIFGKGFMRRLARWLRVAVVDPDANLVSAMRAGAFGLNHGHILILYPEGERTDDGNPRMFRKGAAILSIHSQAPIVPVAIEGFYKAWPRHKKFPKIADLQLVFGKPIQPPPLSAASEAAYDQLTSELKASVVAMWKELREKELRKKQLQEHGEDVRSPEENSKGSTAAEAALH
jgi:long-chain acyl-CoA synthetase